MGPRITPVARNLLIINIAVFLLQWIGDLPLSEWLGFRYIFAESFQPWQVFTYMFVHGDGWHLFGNMFALFIFGPLLEQYFGSQRFLFFYMATGLGAGLFYAIVNHVELHFMQQEMLAFLNDPQPQRLVQFASSHAANLTRPWHEFVYIHFPEMPDNPEFIERGKMFVTEIYRLTANTPMVGASGAVFGILMAFGYLFPNMELMLLFPPIPIKAKYLVGFYALYELYSIYQNRPDDNVAHFAHIGGMIIGFFLVRYWSKTN